MTTQPEALRLADALDTCGLIVGDDLRDAAADELRRLHEEVERLTECLRRANGMAEHFEREWYLRGDANQELLEALEAVMYRIERDLEHGHEWAVVERELARATIAKHGGAA